MDNYLSLNGECRIFFQKLNYTLGLAYNAFSYNEQISLYLIIHISVTTNTCLQRANSCLAESIVIYQSHYCLKE